MTDSVRQCNQHDQAVNARLEKYGRFGVHLGLERIQRLLQALGNPEQRVPIVHVGGTNGKGSVCAYLSSVLTAAGYQTGRYTSPHLVSWRERICINNEPIASAELEAAIAQVEAAIADETETPTQFEVFTAAAWLHFAQQGVDVAVIEVGLGGRLDATNVVDEPLATVITSLSREHWQRLGPTLADIAGEKAGILKPHRPAIIGPLPSEAETVIVGRAIALQAPIVRPQPAQTIGGDRLVYRPAVGPDAVEYTIQLQGEHQHTNSAIAIATLLSLRQQGWQIADEAIRHGMAQAFWPGRLQWRQWQSPDGEASSLLLDGAHNPAAAKVLRRYVDAITAPTPSAELATVLQHQKLTVPLSPGVSWTMGMLSTKDHADVFQALLRPGDTLHLVPVPGHDAMTPEKLRAIAQSVCPQLQFCEIYDTLTAGLAGAIAAPTDLKILCGSLYLVGHYLATEGRT